MGDDEDVPKTREADFTSAETDPHGLTVEATSVPNLGDDEDSAAHGLMPIPVERKDISDPDADFVVLPTDERYENRRRLGEGGMGEVRLCRDRMIGREVAMKVALDPNRRLDLDERARAAKSTDLRHRFVREARVQGQLEHPAIVPVYDFGRDAEGRAFFTMRRVRGVTLEEILDRLRMGDTGAERIHTRHALLAAFTRVCLAVEFAHEHGVLHRDLKPANIMLGRHGEVYVLDWGVAKVRSASRTLEPALLSVRKVKVDAGDDPHPSRPSERIEISGVEGTETAHGLVLGTPQYMSPEQMKGEDIDARSDVYALGAILYEILTLEPLHGTGSLAAILSRATKGAEARASVRSPHREVAPELEQACVHATALKRVERYAHARELADAIEAYLSGDRDLELRQDLAQVHLARAKEAAAGTSLSDRSRALQEVGRALALAPTDRDALAMLVGYLTEPPKKTIPEVEKRIDQGYRQSQHRMLPRAAMAYGLTALVFIPLEILVGAHDVRLALVPLGLWLLAGVFAILASRFAPTNRATFPSVTITAGLALAATSLLHGPLIAVPAVGAVMAMGMTLQAPKHNRPLLVGINVFAVAMPTALALFDLHPVRYAFPNGDILMSHMALAFSLPAFAVLGLMHVALILVGSVFVSSYSEELRALRTRSELQSWQLEQLVPAEAAKAIGESGAVRAVKS